MDILKSLLCFVEMVLKSSWRQQLDGQQTAVLAVTDNVTVLGTSLLPRDQVVEPLLNSSLSATFHSKEINDVYFKNHLVNAPLQLL